MIRGGDYIRDAFVNTSKLGKEVIDGRNLVPKP